MISLKNFTLARAGKRLFTAVNFEFDTNIVYGIYGANGAGKTSLFDAIAGTVDFDGKILLNGGRPRKRDICFVETINYFYPGLKAGEYLEIFNLGEKPPAIPDDAQLLTLLGLPEHQLISTYSTGMKKKLAFIGFLKLNRPVFLLDEPFNGVDAESVMVMKAILNRLKRPGRVIMVTAHQAEYLTGLCDRYVVLEEATIGGDFDQDGFQNYQRKCRVNIERKVDQLFT